MKKLIYTIIFFLMIMQGNAQLTSVKKIKDIKPDDNYYEAVKNLTERYKVLGTEEARQGNNYLPSQPLTHRTFAIVMVIALDKVQEKFDKLSSRKQPNTRDSLFGVFTKKYFKGYADSAVKNLAGYAQYKDVNNDDPDYASVKKLTNYYRLKLGDTDNTFSPDRPMTEKELSTIFGTYFGLRSIVTRASSAIATRGKWAIYMDALLSHLYDTVADFASSQ